MLGLSTATAWAAVETRAPSAEWRRAGALGAVRGCGVFGLPACSGPA